MYLRGLLPCVVLTVVSGNIVPKNGEDLNLKWPSKYTFEAEKISLTAGWVEDIKYWRSKSKSRVDYNKDAVKSFNFKPRLKSKFPFGVTYEVHPETTEDNENYIVCTRTNGSLSFEIELEDILPYDYEIFEHVGSEMIEQDKVEKYSSTETTDDSEIRRTLWATYKQQNEMWAPVRYERITFDLWRDSKIKHEIWNFHEFDTNFDKAVFDVEKLYDCEDSESDEANNPRFNNINPKIENDVDKIFNTYRQNHNKIYANEKEHKLRRNLFRKRLRLVLNNNSKNTGYTLAINKFADRTSKEIKRYMGLVRPSERGPDTHPFPYTASEVRELANNLPDEFDLRDLGWVTPVRDQEDCGSCWTFGTTAAVEGALARKNGDRLLRLSNQALIDCAWGFGAAGCNGGSDLAAYHWMMEYGLPIEEEYGPYANKDGFCRIHNMTTTYPIRGFTNVTPFSVDALKVALVNHGPLSVSIHATDYLLLYNGGIFYDVECEPDVLNHEVTLVGYGKRDGEDYWILKNSWGQNWGVDGYFHLSTRDNNCGVTTEPTYPVL